LNPQNDSKLDLSRLNAAPLQPVGILSIGGYKSTVVKARAFVSNVFTQPLSKDQREQTDDNDQPDQKYDTHGATKKFQHPATSLVVPEGVFCLPNILLDLALGLISLAAALGVLVASRLTDSLLCRSGRFLGLTFFSGLHPLFLSLIFSG